MDRHVVCADAHLVDPTDQGGDDHHEDDRGGDHHHEDDRDDDHHRDAEQDDRSEMENAEAIDHGNLDPAAVASHQQCDASSPCPSRMPVGPQIEWLFNELV